MAIKTIRPIRFEGNVAYVPLTRGYEAVIDAADAPLVEGFNWYSLVEDHTAYAMRSAPSVGGKQKGILMHRALLSAPDDFEVDHIDGSGLNNRRSNLRIATKAQNMRNCRRSRANVSGFKGVAWHARTGKWQVHIRDNGRQVYLGLFVSPEDAHKIYVEAAERIYGAFARSA